MADLPPRLTDDAPRPRLVVKKLRLVVIAGPDKGKELAVHDDIIKIGAHAGADLVLADPKVSSSHCEIQLGGGAAAIVDFSRNGTTVDGVFVRHAFLTNGNTIGVGDDRIRFEATHDRTTIPTSESTRFGALVGSSLAMRAVFAKLEKAAASTSTILLAGESGTGKEGAAAGIHAASGRAGRYEVVACNALPATLIESELFGHVKGAFTGAVADHDGAFQRAHGGTLFLDEIGELGLDLQATLLRALESKTVKRVGGKDYTNVDVRVIAATNRDLRQEVNHKRFREDLYYRLAVLEIRMPPLRDRVADLELLVESILERAGVLGTRDAEALRSPKVLAELSRRRWPGNVRELRNYLERCLVFGEATPPDVDAPAEAPTAPSEDAALHVDTSQPIRAAREQWLNVVERQYVVEILRVHDGNVTQAAKAAGLSRVQFYRVMWKHGLR
jgi:transcriptional regulator with PAS, ATPase and Fis domain